MNLENIIPVNAPQNPCESVPATYAENISTTKKIRSNSNGILDTASLAKRAKSIDGNEKIYNKDLRNIPNLQACISLVVFFTILICHFRVMINTLCRAFHQVMKATLYDDELMTLKEKYRKLKKQLRRVKKQFIAQLNKFIKGVPRILIKMQLKREKKECGHQKRELSFAMYYRSPRQYKAFKKMGFKLPSVRTVQWCCDL